MSTLNVCNLLTQGVHNPELQPIDSGIGLAPLKTCTLDDGKLTETRHPHIDPVFQRFHRLFNNIEDKRLKIPPVYHSVFVT